MPYSQSSYAKSTQTKKGWPIATLADSVNWSRNSKMATSYLVLTWRPATTKEIADLNALGATSGEAVVQLSSLGSLS